ncbi:MAG: chromosomal replication initiator protein DnaA [Acidimicrobiales bacterium]|nr:chromosomal replication initiator protein DnaA [Acidimicrobiales bacterium]
MNEITTKEESATIWAACSEAIRLQVSDVVWQMNFQSTTATNVTDEELVISVPSTVVRDRIDGRYREIVQDALTELSDGKLKLRFEVVTDNDLLDTTPVVPLAVEETSFVPINKTAQSVQQQNTQPSSPAASFGKRLTFDDFVVGTSNRFAAAAALAVAETPGRNYNPLFIYGDAGLGKTHLLHAIANYVRDHYPTHRVRYVSSEVFMNRFVEAIRNKTLPEFKQYYREIDVLLIDDIQFMEGKQGLQEEFFHTFNSLHQAGGQIVLSSDRPPDAIPTLEDRLKSRFKMGLITDIQPPDIETRLAILRKKAEDTSSKVKIPAEVLLFIAENITDNIRELEGALTRVTAFSSLNDVQLTEDMARTVLQDLITANKPLRITPDLILEKTVEMYSFTLDELTGGSRRRPLVTARQISMYVFRDLTDMSYPAIAKEFGGRDHTTVIHAVDKISNLMAERREIYDQVTTLTAAIKSQK